MIHIIANSNLYPIAGMVMFFIFLWGLARIAWPPRNDDD